jgi:anaerobic magnesium-protoporphyrin IX monomethyl ester cyclase
MNIQLFNPPVFYYSGFHYRMLPTMSLPTLSAVFNKAGHHCEVVDLEALQISPDQVRERMTQQKGRWADVIGLTALTITKRGLRETIAAIRDAGFEGRIMVGGVLAKLEPETVLGYGADLVVIGECEGNIVQLVESGAVGIHKGEPMDLDRLPQPDWEHHNPAPKDYIGNTSLLRPNPGITMWTRGCPYSCIFCSNIVFGGKPTRYRKSVDIGIEMRHLKEIGCERIYVYDDELVGTKIPDGWMEDIADWMEPLKLMWVTQGRCSKKFITPELMRTVKRAGCQVIFWGVESFSQRILDAVHKHTTPDDIWHTLRVARDAGIENAVFTMIGNYTETEEDLAITRDALAKAYNEGLIQYRQTTVCTPMPGTELQRIYEEKGWYTEPPDGGRQMLQVTQPTHWLSAQQINDWLIRYAEACPPGIPA